MRNQRKSFFSTGRLVLVSLAGITLLAATGALSAAQKKAAAKEGVLFPHMDKAMGYLKAAQGELQKGEPVFAGHREKAVQDVNAAIANLQKGIDGYVAAHPGTTRNEMVPEAPPVEGKQYPHMEGALKLLQEAQTHLSEGEPLYNGHRIEGLAETKAAIAEVQAGLKAAHK